jgi:hypothetical protein
MSKCKIISSAAILALALAPVVRADEFTKLTLLTFSGPVDVPGITLPAGTYRFSLADPESGRRVVKVADKEGTKTYGMFLSVPNERMTPTAKPVVMFKETAAGAPPAIQVWFYPGESYGYEFAYPHDQALKIAKATHQPVLSYNDHSTASSTDEDRMASMKSAEVARIDENDKPASTDEKLKESSQARTPAATPAATASTTASPTATTTAPRKAATTASRTGVSAQSQTAVGTTGSTSAAPPEPAPRPARTQLPRTASELPLLALIAGMALAIGVGLRLARTTL